MENSKYLKKFAYFNQNWLFFVTNWDQSFFKVVTLVEQYCLLLLQPLFVCVRVCWRARVSATSAVLRET